MPYDAIYDRYRAAVWSRGLKPWQPDEVDWAAIRVIIPVTLRVSDPAGFLTITGQSFEAVAQLGEVAAAAFTQFRAGTRGATFQMGDCRLQFPIARSGDDRVVIAVPDLSSWDGVVPQCAHGRREEFLEALTEAIAKRGGEWALREVQAKGAGDLESYFDEFEIAQPDRPDFDRSARVT